VDDAAAMPRTGRAPPSPAASGEGLEASPSKGPERIRRDPDHPRPSDPPTAEALGFAPVVGSNLRRLRTKRGLSLERLSRASGVSRAMLGQVELGRSAPTINLLWKIAHALGISFSALITDPSAGSPTVLRAAKAKVLTSRDGSFVSRALFPFDAPRSVEFYELRLAPASVERADAHPPGTKENLVVAEGELTMVVGGTHHRLTAGDAILFDADVPHEYRNEASKALHMYLVMTYREDRV
jgi:transcriptional regulator with XRE-family HTH domain